MDPASPLFLLETHRNSISKFLADVMSIARSGEVVSRFAMVTVLEYCFPDLQEFFGEERPLLHLEFRILPVNFTSFVFHLDSLKVCCIL